MTFLFVQVFLESGRTHLTYRDLSLVAGVSHLNQSLLGQFFKVIVFQLILGFNALWDYSTRWNRKNLGICLKQQYNPVVSERSVFYLPFLLFSVPLVPASDSCCDLFVIQRCIILLLAHETSSLSGFIKHFTKDARREWDLLSRDVFFELLT